MESEWLIKKHTTMPLNAGLDSFERRQHHIPPPPLHFTQRSLPEITIWVKETAIMHELHWKEIQTSYLAHAT